MINNERDQCYDDAATMSGKTSSIIKKIEDINGMSQCHRKYLIATHCHVHVFNVDFGCMIRNEPSLSDMYDIMREIWKLLQNLPSKLLI